MICKTMDSTVRIKRQLKKLRKRYKQLTEGAYNFRETDCELSDKYAYDAMKIMNEINRLNYLSRAITQPFSVN